MRARNHVILSTGISLGFQAIVHSWPATFVCFLSGVLIDLDHYIEYYFHRGKLPDNYKELFNFCVPYKEKKIYLIFHAYEYLFILWLLIFFFHLNSMWLGLAIGLTAHLISDQIANPIVPLGYLLTYRIQSQFESFKIIKQNN